MQILRIQNPERTKLYADLLRGAGIPDWGLPVPLNLFSDGWRPWVTVFA